YFDRRLQRSVTVYAPLARSVTLSAIAFKSGMTDSAVWSDIYDSDNSMSADPLGATTDASITTDTLSASSSGGNVTYDLDKAGNRTSIVDTGVTKTYSPNNLNEYTAAEGSTVTNGSEHEVASYQSVNYTYINDERLSSVTSGSNNY